MAVIYLVTGPLGSGKSFYATAMIADALERGKPVATNVPLREGFERKIANHNIFRWLVPFRRRQMRDRIVRSLISVDPTDPAGLRDLFRIRLHGRGEGRGVVVLDEAHEWLNSRAWAEEDRGEIVSWFRMSRKLGWDVYLISQDAESIDKQVRVVFTYHVQLRNLRQMKVAGIPVIPFKIVLAIHTFHAGSKKAVAKRDWLRVNWRRRLYDTLGLHGLAAAPPDAVWLPLPKGGSAGGSGPGGAAPPPPALASEPAVPVVQFATSEPVGSSNSPPGLTGETASTGAPAP